MDHQNQIALCRGLRRSALRKKKQPMSSTRDVTVVVVLHDSTDCVVYVMS
jgi:hypothetical protein